MPGRLNIYFIFIRLILGENFSRIAVNEIVSVQPHCTWPIFVYEISPGFSRDLAGLLFRNVNIDIDAGGRSDRPEWGQAQYHNIFQPGEAFELIVEWMVATGYIIADLVSG